MTSPAAEASHLTIPGVPATITRADYTRLVESLGLSTHGLIELVCHQRGIYAKVLALDEQGHHTMAGHEPAVHEVFIRVVE